MKILNICIRDYGGKAYNLAEAIRRHTGHEARCLCMLPHKYEYSTDIVTHNKDEMREWILWADVVNAYQRPGPLIHAGVPRPDCLIMMGGGIKGGFLRDPEAWTVRARNEHGARRIMATHVSLMRFDVVDEWLPHPIPVDDYLRLHRRKRQHGGLPVICHTWHGAKEGPRQIKAILEGRRDLVLDTIKDLSHQECLQRKAAATLYVEARGRGYSVSALEAFAMGIPVVSHAWPEEEANYLKHIGHLPYYDAPLEEMPAAIGALLGDQRLYREYANRGLQYMRDFHDYPIVAQRFAKICEGLIG